jgi:phosphoglucosamine mutase
MNINDNCGSTHIEVLQSEVLKEKADFGLAFDGDGDRLIAVDENGREINGDAIMYLCAKYLHRMKKLRHNTLVVTVMSNIGLKLALQSEGIDIVETQVGDRYILQKMMENNFNLGGEQSGHIIYSDINTTGDGLITSMLLASIIASDTKAFSEHLTGLLVYPQILVNVRVEPEKKLLYQNNTLVEEAVRELSKKYQGEGRILLRHSGTEPLVRIMIEGKNQEAIQKDANTLAELIAKISK